MKKTYFKPEMVVFAVHNHAILTTVSKMPIHSSEEDIVTRQDEIL